MSNHTINTIGVIGGGAFGSALASVAQNSLSVKPVVFVRRDPDAGQTTNINDLLKADALIYAVKAQALPDVLPRLIESDLAQKPLLIAAKGLLEGQNPLLINAATKLGWQGGLGILSGPGFAADIINKRPFAVTIASEDLDLAKAYCEALATPKFRPYASSDPVGVSLAGALKNVIAIACGITIGLGLGESARAALLARGLAEITRIGVAMGAEAKTFRGLAGVGDLALTCTSEQSRNFRCGFALGRGGDLTQIELEIGTVEGIRTTAAVVGLASSLGVDMPISKQLNKILFEGQSVADGIQQLLARDIGLET